MNITDNGLDKVVHDNSICPLPNSKDILSHPMVMCLSGMDSQNPNRCAVLEDELEWNARS